MISCLYISQEIRGIEGEGASEHLQRHNIDLACKRVEVLRESFPEIEFICPHENEMVNAMVFYGHMSGDVLVHHECQMIANWPKIQGVLVIGDCHVGTGCGKEAVAAHEAGKLVCFIKSVSPDEQDFFDKRMASWERE